MSERWNIHLCWRDPDCQQVGPVYRAHLNTPRGSLIVAARRDYWIQAWLPFAGYQLWWAPIVWHPRARARR
jgi:hypothetical protein